MDKIDIDKVDWIKNLVRAEQQMEKTGTINLYNQEDTEEVLEIETHDFLQNAKTAFVEAVSSFNKLKDSSLGTVKIYGIAKTKLDFMLFRNGHKLIFSMKQPGQVSILFQNIASSFAPPLVRNEESNISAMNETTITAQWGAFGDMKWSYQGHVVQLDSLVRYYLSRFIRESAR